MLVSSSGHYSSGPFHQPQPLAVEVDPFESLYNSLANLTLTAASSLPVTPSGAVDRAKTAAEPIIPDAAPIPPVASAVTNTPSSFQNEAPIPVNIIFPPGDNVIFAHSSYYRQFRELPSILHVRTQAILAAGRLPLPSPSYLVPFPDQGLLVNYGPDANVSAAEGKNLVLLKQIFKLDEVPVPEIFGWRRDAEHGERVIYTSLPVGNTLEDRWGGLTDGEKARVCVELRDMVKTWRRLQQGNKHKGREIIGSIDNTPLNDQVFRLTNVNKKMTLPPPGPFPNVSNFHSYFVATAVAVSQSKHAGSEAGQVNYQPHHLFPDSVPITFTHGALHPRNIIISEGPNPRVVSIIGWEQAGWYPAYWELCKARWECSRRGSLGDWETRYLPGILSLDGFGLEMQGWNGRALCQYWDYFVGLMHQWE